MHQTLELKMITLTQLTQDLQIGKSKLYRLMEELEINPHQDGRRRILDEEQIQKIQQIRTCSFACKNKSELPK